VTLEERDGPLARSDVYEDFRRVDARSLARVLKRSGQLSAVRAQLKAES
jgi:hypothetical protein